MIERIKAMPWGVKVAILFLMAVYVAMCVMIPMLGLFFSVVIGIFISLLRLFHYLEYEE